MLNASRVTASRCFVPKRIRGGDKNMADYLSLKQDRELAADDMEILFIRKK